MFAVSRTIDRYDATFDHDGLIANAGLIVVATLMSRLGLERLADTAQQALFPDWRHHSFITNRHDLTTIEADRFHRDHAVVELAIRELKHGGAEHIPSGHYPANAAWFACAVIAHNLGRWTVLIGKHQPVNTRTLRTRIIAVPAVTANRSGRHTLRFPTRWPWQHDFATMLDNLRALPGPAG